MQTKLTLFFLMLASVTYAQKKPLDHSVYDTWESVGVKQISNEGTWTAFGVNLQEGDGSLYFQSTVNTQKLKIPRGTTAAGGLGAGGSLFSPDGKFAAFTIKPQFKDTRLAKIKKKKADEMTKDTLGIANLITLAVTKIPRVKSFKFPENGAALLAYNLEKPIDTAKKTAPAGAAAKNDEGDFFADDEPAGGAAAKEGTDLIVKNLTTGVERTFKYVTEYTFSKDGKRLVYAASGSKKDKSAPGGVFLLNNETGLVKSLVKVKGNFKGFVFDDDSERLAFLGETSPEKQEIKNFNIYYNSPTLDTAQILVDSDMTGMPDKFAVSGDGRVSFSKDGQKIFFGIAPIKKAKDTTIVDFENAKLDIWGYKDDYLQPMQLKNADRELKRSYLTAIDIYSVEPKIVPLTDAKLPEASLVNEGNANFVLASTDYGNRIPSQWTGGTVRDYYLVDVKTGIRKKIIESLDGNASASPNGNYIIYYNDKDMTWNTYQVATGTKTILNTGMSIKFYDEENDVPALPNSYGIAGWGEDDKTVYLYDRYDIWAFSPDGKSAPKNFTNGFGRANNLTLRVERTDPEARFFNRKDLLWLDAFNNITKNEVSIVKQLTIIKYPKW